MPLQHSSSPQAFKANVRTLMDERGVSPHVKNAKQALAIAYATKRRAAHRAMGGIGLSPASWQTRAEARNLMHTGPILSAVPGRTDRHNMAVPSGSYVLPADSVSHLGQSNSLAGLKVANNMFGAGGPYGAGAMRIAHGPGAPRPPKQMGIMADRGGARGDNAAGSPVPIIAAGGEFVIRPEIVASIGGGDIKRGHKILDKWVLKLREDHKRTLKKLPPPAKS